MVTDNTAQPQAQTPANGDPAPPISLYQKGDIEHILSDDGERRQSMVGFDDEFKDIVDYIIKVTHRIWEDKAIGYIYHHYLHNAVIHTSSGDIYGRDQVIAGTIQALAAFPDRRLYGDDVIWKHSPGDVYYSSHRITHEGRNYGHTPYGPPTGRKVRYGAIADCVVRENQIIEEWLVRDELLLIDQLGFDAHELARTMAEAEQTIGAALSVPGEVDRLRGQLPPLPIEDTNPDSDLETWIRSYFQEVWNWRLLNRVGAYFAPHAQIQSASGRRLHGIGAFQGYLLSLLSPFPDLAVSVDHFCAIPDANGTQRAATRWSLQGTHTGPGIYGKATGKRVAIFGVTHHLIEAGKITREWTLFDEFALLKQLYAPD